MAIASNGRITLSNAHSKGLYELDTDFGHLAPAYCITSHAAQGKTVDKVLIDQPAATFQVTNAKRFCVSVSPGKECCCIYTVYKGQLLEFATEFEDRQSESELVADADMTKEVNKRIRAESQLEPSIEPLLLIRTPSKEYDYRPPMV